MDCQGLLYTACPRLKNFFLGNMLRKFVKIPWKAVDPDHKWIRIQQLGGSESTQRKE